MLTKAQNDELTRVGPGTPMGELMRRYWHPIAPASELDENPTREVRLLGEDLVLYKDRSGALGLIDRFCAHRRVNLSYGIPEERGLRCMYHGWLYDETGQCIEQPFEETVRPEARFKDKIKMKGYRVEELGGLIFAYLGPEPAPLVPRWDFLVQGGNTRRELFITEIPCNWLQCQENSLDPIHLEWLHGYYGMYTAERKGLVEEGAAGRWVASAGHHRKIGFEVFDYGIIKRRIWSTTSEESSQWELGHPILFPNILHQGGDGRYFLQFRVPIDDMTTWHLEYTMYWLPEWLNLPPQKNIPVTYYPLRDERGYLRNDDILDQDHMAWVAQGELMDRSLEHLGESDRGIILFRKLLQEQMAVVQDGGDPMCVIRDPAKNEYVHIPQEALRPLPLDADLDVVARYGSKFRQEFGELMKVASDTAPADYWERVGRWDPR